MSHRSFRSTLWGTIVAVGSVVLFAACGGSTERDVEADETSAASLRVPPASSALAVPISGHTIHREEGGLVCADCHVNHGMSTSLPFLLYWSPKAIIPGGPQPTFDVAAGTCSNVACHSIPSGTFSYWFAGGDGEPELRQIAYGGPVTTPPWAQALRGACRACHASPPQNGAWHSTSHGGGGANAACSLCHPGISVVGGELTITGTTHRNGVVDVTPRFRSSCFGCH